MLKSNIIDVSAVVAELLINREKRFHVSYPEIGDGNFNGAFWNLN